MRIGVFLLSAQFPGHDHTSVLQTTLRAAAAAESAGFDGVWLAEHHFMSYGVCPSAITLAGFVLGRTRTIEVGTAVSVLSTQHPVALAEQANLLDQVSGGRFRLGVGRGGPWVDLEVFGTGLDRYELAFPESLGLLLRALRGGGVRADGATFGFREVEIVPGPRTLPRLPVVVAATSTATVEVAARHGLPLLLGLHQTAREQEEMLAGYRQLAGEHGAEPATEHIVATLAHVSDTGAQARKTVLSSLPEWLEPGLAGYVPVDGRRTNRRDPREYARFLCDTHAVGSPRECADRLLERAGTGAAELIMMVETTGEESATLDNIARLGEEVLPLVRAAL